MNKPIIIDGCNVAECPFYEYQSADDYKMKHPESGDCEIGMAGYLYEYDRIREELEKACIDNPNCLFKQLQRLKAENEKLLKELQYKYEEMNAKDFLLMGEDLNFWKNLKAEYKHFQHISAGEVHRLRKALIGVREIINSYCLNMCNGCSSACINHEIEDKINEVLKDE